MQRLRQGLATGLQLGPVPAHLAFIMDGNRRFAEYKLSGDKALGHIRGFAKLLQALEWCLDLGVSCVSVYAFSIENFNRSPEEVSTLMRLAETKLDELLEEAAVVKQHGVQVRVLGDLSLLPSAVRAAAERVIDATRSNGKAVLNICLAYTSTQEMAQAMPSAKEQEDITDVAGALGAFESQLYTRGCPPVDLLIRTSGESRLSDFLLPQSSHALLHFTPVLWPDFSFLNLLAAVVAFQRSHADISRTRSLADVAAASGSVAGASCERGVAPPPQPLAANTHPTAAGHDDGLSESKETSRGCQTPGEAVGTKLCLSTDVTLDPGGAKTPETQQPGLGLGPATLAGAPSGNQSPSASDASWTIAAVGPPVPDLRPFATPQQAGGEASGAAAAAARRRGRRPPVSLRDADLRLDPSGLFAAPQERDSGPLGEAVGDRASELRQAGIAGGYDSMEEDDLEAPHAGGCPCCIVRFMPMHRVCRDPTPAVAALRKRT